MQHSFVHEEKEKHCKLFLGGIEIICAVLLIVLLIFLVLLVEHQTFFQWSMIHLIIRHSGRIAILLGILAFIIYFKSGKIRKFFERYLYNRIVVGALILSLMATFSFYIIVRRLDGEFSNDELAVVFSMMAIVTGLLTLFVRKN